MTGRALVVQAKAEELPLPAGSVDAVVCDPPYNLSFMGRPWDSVGGHQAFQAWCQQWATDALRVLKPGGWLLAFGGTRTWHRLTCGIEDAGFELRDQTAVYGPLSWLYGSGFPKSLDVGKAIDKAAGAEREVVGRRTDRAATPIRDIRGGGLIDNRPNNYDGSAITAPATPEAERWQGWGTALKPAWEPVVVARKPLAGTVAQNVLTWGTGALNIDASRIGTESTLSAANRTPARKWAGGEMSMAEPTGSPSGRWPPNVVLVHDERCQPTGVRKIRGSKWGPSGDVTTDPARPGWGMRRLPTAGEQYQDPDGTETIEAWACVEGCPVLEIDRQSGELSSHGGGPGGGHARSDRMFGLGRGQPIPKGDSGGASRFYATFHPGHDSSTMEACPPPGDASTTDASTSAGKRTASSDDSSPTDGSGSRPTAPSPLATTSTTGTTTHSTTTSATSNASPEPSTSATTADTARTTPSSGESSTDGASGVTSTGPSESSPSGQQAPIRVTARTAPSTTSESGEQPTASTTTPTCVPIASGESSSRFYYTAKADRNERVTIDGDSHPTVKPLDLVRWLVRLVAPPGGLVLDMFGGSGTTGEAALLEGFTALVIDKDPASCAKAKVRANPYVRRRHVITGPLVGPEQGSLL